MSKHTPTPWEAQGRFIAPFGGNVLDRLAACFDDYGLNKEAAEANAAHIVKCVNERDELVAALEECMRLVIADRCDSDDDDSCPAVNFARIVLAKANP